MPSLALTVLVVLAVAGLLAGPAGASDPPGFLEDFSSPALGPEWQVVQTHPGGVPRAHGFTSPGNRYSLGDRPGFLRYLLDPMTHWDGYVIEYATTAGVHSCCTHDAGLELHRPFSGEHWLLEARAIYFMPFTNGRDFDLRVYWGDGGPGTYFVQLVRGRDLGQNFVFLGLALQTGNTVADYTPHIVVLSPGGVPVSDSVDVWWRIERSGGEIGAYWSFDGIVWTLAWSHDLGNALHGLDQRVVITGLSWFNTGGSYADWDYVNVVPTTIPVDLDIHPGSEPNALNPRSRGNVPVAVLGSADFDVTAIDVSTLRFGPAGATPRHRHAGHVEDVNGDAYDDMVLHFRTPDTGIALGDDEACLTGMTNAGLPIEGCDDIVTVGGGS